MGARADSIAQSAAQPREIMALAGRASYLHDGQAATVDAAIAFHDGEAAMTRNRYTAISSWQKQQLLLFPGSI